MEDVHCELDRLLKTISELKTDFQTLNEYQISYNQYIETSRIIYDIFRQQMKNVVNECIQSRHILNNIQCELEIAFETKRFDYINTFEIHTDSKKLLKNLEEMKERNEPIKNDIENIMKLISDEKKIEDNKWLNKMCRFVDKNASEDIVEITCLLVASDLTFFSEYYSLKKIAVGVLFTGVLAKTIIYCKKHEAKMLSELTNNLIKHMSDLQQHSIDFGLFLSGVIKELINSITSAEKNVSYNSLTGVRVEKLTGKAIKEISALLTSFFQVELRARALSENTLVFKKNELIN